MGSERIKVERKIKDCGNGWCGDPGDCKGHYMKYTYDSIVDYSTIELDGERWTAPDNVIDALADMIVKANKGAVK